jgi:predicted nucleic acid-binding protein
MKVLLDTNLILDLMLERAPWSIEAQAIAELESEGQIVAYVGASTITDIFYISRKLVGVQKAREIVRACLDRLQIISVSRELLDAAHRRGSKDFEDDLQIECALTAGLDAIVTRDPKGFAGSSLPVYSTAELMARISNDENA